MAKKTEKKTTSHSLGSYLFGLRKAKRLTLRDVEEATGKEVSNAYLSQLEHGRISKPSPNILYSLANVYGAPYEALMEKSGYIVAAGNRESDQKHGRAATFADYDLTSDEEEELLNYLAFLRSRSKHDKT